MWHANGAAAIHRGTLWREQGRRAGPVPALESPHGGCAARARGSRGGRGDDSRGDRLSLRARAIAWSCTRTAPRPGGRSTRRCPISSMLDIGLPRMDGLELCRRLRTRTDALPIIFVTSREDEFDRVLGLEIGADDYLCKPFSMRELMARVKVLLRRARSPAARAAGCRGGHVRGRRARARRPAPDGDVARERRVADGHRVPAAAGARAAGPASCDRASS